MSDPKPTTDRFVVALQHLDTSGKSLVEQHDNLRRDRQPSDLYDEQIFRWLLTDRLSTKEEAASYVLKTLNFLREKSPDDATLKSERAESALRDEFVRWAPKFALLWEGRAHFTVSTVTDKERDSTSRVFSIATHSGDTQGADSILTDTQNAIDEDAISLLATTGEEGKKLSEDIRGAIERRDEICARYFSKRGLARGDWEFVADTISIRRFLSLEPLQKTHDDDVKKGGGPLEDTHPLVYIRKEIHEFVSKTGIQEKEFKPFLYDIWRSEMDDVWISDVNVPRWAKWLMVALWLDVVAPQLERERAKHPALVFVAHEEALNMLSRARLAEDNRGQRGMGFPGDDIAHVDFSLIDTALRERVENGFRLFGSTTSHKVFRLLVLSGHRQALLHIGDPRVLNITGAYGRLAEDLNLKSKAEVERIRDIIEAMHIYEVQIGERKERILTRTYARGAGPKPAELSIILGFPLLPNYVQDLQDAFKNRIAERMAKRLVPVLSDPPLIGRERDHGAQYSFQMAVVQRMRLESESIVKLGGVTLDKATLEQLAKVAGLPPTLLDPVIDRWTQDGTDGPKMLERVDGDVYRLGDAHKPAWDFMVSGATKEAHGRRWAQKGLAKKNAKIAKRGK